MRDDLVVYELMVEEIWRRQYRTELEKRLRQQELVVRAHQVGIR